MVELFDVVAFRKLGKVLRRNLGLLCCITWLNGLVSWAAPAPEKMDLYDPDPQHLWNRLHEALFIRTDLDGVQHGFDQLTLLYWAGQAPSYPGTKHLLIEPAYTQALATLDQFLSTQGERLIRDPLKRALLQHDLWALFDWSVDYYPGTPDLFPVVAS